MANYKDFDDGFEPEYEEDEYDDIKEEYIERPIIRRSSKKKKNKKWIIILIVVLEVIVLAAFIGIYYVVKKISLIERTPINEEYIVTNPDIKQDTVEVLSGYTNILLLGTDNRNNEDINNNENHTDAILVASINNDTKEVRIVSIYRDCILEMSSCGEPVETKISKATEAAWYYGIESTISMINRNLDLDIEDFVMLNWSALIELVDAVGGIDLEITQMEQRWTNRYLVDTSENTGVSYTELIAFEDDPNLSDLDLYNDKEKMSTKKKVHMDGIQATSYARVRFGDGLSDYGRTRRQRDVITQIFAKAKNMNIGRLNSIVTAICKNLSTSLETTEILGMLPNVMKYKLVTLDGGFPFFKDDQHTEIAGISKYELSDPVIPVTLEKNVIEFHKLLFGDDKYVPSDTVKTISKKIVDMTGVSE